MTSLPATMTAIVVQSGNAVVSQVAVPRPGPAQVLVRVHASAMNRADLSVAAGHKHGSVGGDGTVIGMEWAGVVVETGAQVPASIAVGDRVMCSGTAGYAQYAVSDFGRVLKIPEGVDFETASTLPVALQTMHEAIATSGAFVKGQTVLIQGASTGVGLMGLQIAKVLGASKVIGSSTNAARRARLAEFGADLAVDSNDPAWVAQVLDATGGAGVDLVVDMVSGKTVNQSMAATRICGRIVNVGRLGGTQENFDFDLHALRRIHYVGVTFRTRTLEEVRAISVGVQRDLSQQIQGGKLRLPIDRTFALGDAAAALAHMKSNAHFGKLLLLPDVQ
jgi:NADPH2:quinone reductase